MPRRTQGAGDVALVSAPHALSSPVRLYDRSVPLAQPNDVPEGQDWKTALNPDSLTEITGAMLEPSLAATAPAAMCSSAPRLLYADPVLSKPGAPVWNRTVTLKDAWAKLEPKS